MLSQTRGLYITSMISASLIEIAGTVRKDGDHMLLAVAIPYLLWFILFILFVWSSTYEIAKESEFLMFMFVLSTHPSSGHN
ncbi:hypothetical protein PFICI_01490 [Pestalotiopsis fici W106-1]|uniref:Uncharacterized protein n=1 Tax=Pestalotiopsis fici (strain W106-1 / CGMCC3.15140) TaxID=1229662 RepID=W3XQ79_PESFW|nr:uncharacterized protein PFICI_01490 [Pestalotiopsis fici W106-1]ETS87662.1 hypothetical protein PFICI_01490 [Pestalotiopsis fici W106-1]